MKTTSMNLRKLDKRHTLTVTINTTREFKVRVFLAVIFIKIAGFVLGCGIKVEK